MSRARTPLSEPASPRVPTGRAALRPLRAGLVTLEVLS